MVDEEDLYTLRVNCKGKRTVGKANKAINAQKINRFKKLRFKKEKRNKRGKIPQNCKSPCRGRGLYKQ